jgi:hypothetical protein
MMFISPIHAEWGIQSECMAAIALQACKYYQIAVIQFGQRIAWLYRVKS